MIVFKTQHYGVDVTVQICDDFRRDLHDAGISYTELPILEPNVLTYDFDQKHMFAVIVSGPESGDRVYLTTQVPLDMDWNALVSDCDAQQERRAEPMPLRTKASVIVEKAEQMARDAEQPDDFWAKAMFVPSTRGIVLSLFYLGYTVDDLIKMDHHDIDRDFLDELRRA